MSVITEILYGNLTVTVGVKNKNRTPEQINGAKELMRLAEMGETVKQEIENCHNRMFEKVKECYMKTCPGRYFCSKFKRNDGEL